MENTVDISFNLSLQPWVWCQRSWGGWKPCAIVYHLIPGPTLSWVSVPFFWAPEQHREQAAGKSILDATRTEIVMLPLICSFIASPFSVTPVTQARTLGVVLDFSQLLTSHGGAVTRRCPLYLLRPPWHLSASLILSAFPWARPAHLSLGCWRCSQTSLAGSTLVLPSVLTVQPERCCSAVHLTRSLPPYSHDKMSSSLTGTGALLILALSSCPPYLWSLSFFSVSAILNHSQFPEGTMLSLLFSHLNMFLPSLEHFPATFSLA